MGRRVLIAGCGYLGTATAKLFLRAGYAVEGWTRSGTSDWETAPAFEIRAVDVSAADAVMRAEGEFDVVIHCASTRGGDAADYEQVYGKGVENLRRRFSRAQLIFVSSTSVYPQRNGEWVDEASPAEPTHERGKILRAAEELVLGNSGSVARLGGIYGPDRSALLRRVLNGEAAIDLTSDRFVNQVHRDDAAEALLKLADLKSERRIRNVVDNEPLLLRDCYRWLAERLHRPLVMGASPRPRKRGDSNKRVSNALLRSDGWEPQYPSFKEGMERSVLPASET